MKNLYIITGTGAGLGLALAKTLLARRDSEVVCLSRTRASGIDAARFHPLDLSDPHAIDPVWDMIEREIGNRTFEKAVLINNAGCAGPVGPIESLETAALVRNLNVNLVSALVLMTRFLAMTEGRAATRRVINISSGLGRKPMFGTAAYCAAKAGIDMFSRAAALEAQTRATGVQIVSIAPGLIDTGMQKEMRSQPAAALPDVGIFQQFKSSGALRPPDDVAADILRLESIGAFGDEPVTDLRTLTAAH